MAWVCKRLNPAPGNDGRRSTSFPPSRYPRHLSRGSAMWHTEGGAIISSGQGAPTSTVDSCPGSWRWSFRRQALQGRPRSMMSPSPDPMGGVPWEFSAFSLAHHLHCCSVSSASPALLLLSAIFLLSPSPAYLLPPAHRLPPAQGLLLRIASSCFRLKILLPNSVDRETTF